MRYKLKNEILNRFKSEAEKYLLLTDKIPDIAIVAGSGIAQSIPSELIINRINYCDFNCFPEISVAGHTGEMLLLNLFNKHVLIFSGRFHLYEGRNIEEICSLVIFTKLIGTNNLVLTNAAGGLNYKFIPGDLMLINDVSSIQKANLHSLFEYNVTDYTTKIITPFSNEFISKIKNELTTSGIPYHVGTYLAVSGPTYETRAEIRMMRKMQVDAVGMSTFIEAVCGYYLGLNVAACSLITNAAKEVPQKVSHEEVTDIASKSSYRIWKFIESAIKAAI
jgi:purine-nucleoside phosphorylase